MSNKNYNKMSKPEKSKIDKPITSDEYSNNTNLESDKSNESNKIKKNRADNKTFIVSNCKKLNVREAPYMSANIVGIIDAGTKVNVLNEKLVKGFYEVSVKLDNETTLHGYCMKNYLSSVK